MDNAYKMLADLTKNTRVTIDTALNFINGLPKADSYTALSEDNAEIRLKAKQIAQDLNIDSVFSNVKKETSQAKRRKSETLAPPQRVLKQPSPCLSITELRATGEEKSKLYAEAQAKTRQLAEEIREEVIAQRAKELAERQRIRIQEEARLLVEKEREKTAKIMEEQKERYRMEALEKCAVMMARRKQVIIATQALVGWKAHIKILNRNETIIRKNHQSYLLQAALRAWLSHFTARREAYEKERQRLRAETLKSRMRMAETNYVVVLMKKALLAMRLEAQRLQTRRRQEEQRACRERRVQSFIQRIEVSKSLCLSQNETADASSQSLSPIVAPYTEIQEQKQREDSLSTDIKEEQQGQNNKSVNSKPNTPSKRVRFESIEEPQAPSINDQKPSQADNLGTESMRQTVSQPTARKLLRKAPQAYIDYSKRAAERKQERLRRLEEDRLAREQAEHSQKILQEELARRKAQVRKEQLEMAASYHTGILLRTGLHSLTTFHTRLTSWKAIALQRIVHCAFSIWNQKTRERLVKKIEIITVVDDTIGRIMDRVTKQSVFSRGFLPLLQQSRQRFLQADKLFALNLCRRSFVSMQKCLHQADVEARLRGEKLRSRVLGRTVIFAWKSALLGLRRERMAETRQTEVYKLMRAQVAVQWEEMVDRFILESFSSFYDRFEPVIRSFEEVIDSSSIESLAEATLCRLLHPSDDLPPQLPAQSFPSLLKSVQFQQPMQMEEKTITDTADEEEMDFSSLAALISAAKQITGQASSANQQGLEFTYDFSAIASRPDGASIYAADSFALSKLLNHSAGALTDRDY